MQTREYSTLPFYVDLLYLPGQFILDTHFKGWRTNFIMDHFTMKFHNAMKIYADEISEVVNPF